MNRLTTFKDDKVRYMIAHEMVRSLAVKPADVKALHSSFSPQFFSICNKEYTRSAFRYGQHVSEVFYSLNSSCFKEVQHILAVFESPDTVRVRDTTLNDVPIVSCIRDIKESGLRYIDLYAKLATRFSKSNEGAYFLHDFNSQLQKNQLMSRINTLLYRAFGSLRRLDWNALFEYDHSYLDLYNEIVKSKELRGCGKSATQGDVNSALGRVVGSSKESEMFRSQADVNSALEHIFKSGK